MGFLFGNSHNDKAKMLQTIMVDRKLEVKEHQVTDEIKKLSSEIYQLQGRVVQIEDELSKLTVMLNSKEYQPQWHQLEAQRLTLEKELERLTDIELAEAKQLRNKLDTFRVMVRAEEKIDRKVA